MSDLVTVAVFETESAAAPARSMLEAQGIRTCLEGATVGTMLWYIGPALAGVKLQVLKEDLPGTREILQQHFADVAAARGPSAPQQQAWTCPECGAEVDAGFEICWSCGKIFGEETIRDEPEPTPEETRTLQAAEGGSTHPGKTSEPFGWHRIFAAFIFLVMLGLIIQLGAQLEQRPLLFSVLLLPLLVFGITMGMFVTSPRELKSRESTEQDEEAPPEEEAAAEFDERDALLDRAYRASMFGSVFLPPVITIYSILLLIRYNASVPPEVRWKKWKFIVAVALNILVLWWVLTMVLFLTRAV